MARQYQPRAPVNYPQTFMRNNLPESEPLSEYSEMQMTPLQTRPTPYRHVTLHETKVCQDERLGSGSPFFTRQLATSYPQSFATYNKHEPMFVMHSLSSPVTNSSLPKRFASEQRIVGTSSTATPKMNNYGLTKITPQKGKTKLSSVESTRFFVGTTDQVVRWHKIAKKAQLYVIYEVSAVLDKIYFNPTKGMYNMILRNEQRRTLPLLASFYRIDRDIPKTLVGQLITCVGRMVGSNKLQVYDVWPTTTDCLIGIQRTSYLCQRILEDVNLTVNES